MKALLTGLILLLLVTTSSPAMSAEMAAPVKPEPQTLRWRTGVIRISVSSSLTAPNSAIKADSDPLGALHRSLAAWAAVTGLQFRVETSDRQSVSAAGSAGDGVSLITVASTPENLQLFSKDPFGQSARTRVFFDRRGGITEADIVLNPLQQFSTDGSYGTFDLESTLTHEVGHLLGLKHSLLAGSIMAGRSVRNGDQYSGPRPITAADAAAARDLYLTRSDTCCSYVSGRITGMRKTARDIVVWAEDSESRVVGQGQVSSDGSYRIGGLSEGSYRVRWGGDGYLGDVGSVKVAPDSPAVISKRAAPVDRSDLRMDLVGLNMQPTDSAVVLSPGRQYYVCIGGTGFSDGLASVRIGSKYFHITAFPVKADFGSTFDAASFNVTVDSDTPDGVYTLYAERSDGSRAAFIGAVVVTR